MRKYEQQPAREAEHGAQGTRERETATERERESVDVSEK